MMADASGDSEALLQAVRRDTLRLLRVHALSRRDTFTFHNPTLYLRGMLEEDAD